MTAPRHGSVEWEWRRAEALVEDPDAVEVMLGLHALREGQRRCVQCGVPWPCVFWQVATLARMLQAGASPRRHKGPISWFAHPPEEAISAHQRG